jgi:sirohydrochlorin ferrochelatase
MASQPEQLILVAHGTRSPQGVRAVGELAAAVSGRIGPVRTAFVDVLGPNPAEVLAGVTGPAIVVPAFLASGYHVRTDLPARIAESGHRATAVTRALGPDPVLAEVMNARLIDVGWRRGDVVVMAAAGSSDAGAQREVICAAAMLAGLVGEVHLGWLATGAPRVRDVVGVLRAAGRRRIFIASYLLAPGLFHARLHHYGATAVTAPLGVHPDIVELVARRFSRVDGVGRQAQPRVWGTM